ncbi:MAG: hemolysin III family protein [archaeon]|nr:hemolysin III family protein [archaeon]
MGTIFLSIMTVFSVSLFVFSLTPDYHSPERRILRGCLFLILGITAGFPIIYLVLFQSKVKGFDKQPKYHLWYLGGIIYVLGGVIYVYRCPEKYRIGKHDYFGASHQFLHLGVLIGVILHYLGCLDAYYYRVENQCPAV